MRLLVPGVLLQEDSGASQGKANAEHHHCQEEEEGPQKSSSWEGRGEHDLPAEFAWLMQRRC